MNIGLFLILMSRKIGTHLDWIGENNPIPNTDKNLCWNVTQDVTIDEIGRVTVIEPEEETIGQTYNVLQVSK